MLYVSGNPQSYPSGSGSPGSPASDFDDPDVVSSDSNHYAENDTAAAGSVDGRKGMLTDLFHSAADLVQDNRGSFASSAVAKTTDIVSRHQEQPSFSLESDDDSGDEGAVTWKLSLSPTSMTLDTNIRDVTSLCEVIKQLSINVQPQTIADSADRDDDDADTEDNGPRIRRNNATFQPWEQGPMIWVSPYFGSKPKNKIPPPMINDYNRALIRPDVIDHCITIYFECYNRISPLIDQRSFLAAYQAPNSNIDSMTLLQVSVCAVSARHVFQIQRRFQPQYASYMALVFYTRARALLEDMFDAEPNLNFLQALLLLSMYPNISPLFLEGYSYEHSNIFVGLAVRMAHWMELHRLDDASCNRWSDVNLEPVDKELYRRVWWHIVIADTMCSYMFRSHLLIDDNIVKVNFPSRLEHEDEITDLGLAFFRQKLQLQVIQRSRSFRLLYRNRVDTPSKAIIDTLENDLHAWHNALPDYMQHDVKKEPGPFISGPEGEIEKFKWLTGWIITADYHQVWIYIHQLFLPPSFGQGPFSNVPVSRTMFPDPSPEPDSPAVADVDSDDPTAQVPRTRRPTANDIYMQSLRVVLDSSQILTGLLTRIIKYEPNCYFSLLAFSLAVASWLRFAETAPMMTMTTIKPTNVFVNPTLPPLARVNLSRLLMTLRSTSIFTSNDDKFVQISNTLEGWIRDLPESSLPETNDIEKVSETWMARFVATLDGSETPAAGKAAGGTGTGRGGKTSRGSTPRGRARGGTRGGG